MTETAKLSKNAGSEFSLGQSVVAHGSVYTFSQLANQAMGFVLLPVYAKILGSKGFAVLSILAALAAVMTVLMGQGMVGAWFRFRFDKKKREEVQLFESTILWYLLATGPVLILVLTLWGDGLARLATPGIPFFPLVLLALLAAFAGIFPTLYERKLQAEQKPVRYALFSGARTLSSLLLIILFVVGFRRGVQGKLEADLICFGSFGLLMMVLVGLKSPFRFSKPDLKISLAYGLPLVPHSLAGWTNNMIDRFIVNLLLGLSATGVYSMGYQIAGLAMVLGVSMNQAYTPLFFQTFKRIESLEEKGVTNEIEGLLKGIARTGLMLVAIVVCFSFLLSCSVRELLLVLTTPEFKDSWSVVSPVTAGMVAISCYFVFVQPIAYSSKLVRFMPLMTALASMVNILTNLALIPRIGIFGSALATLASNAALAVLALRVSKKSRWRVPFDWHRWGGLLFTAAVGLSGIWLLDRLITDWYVRLPLKIIAFLLFVLLTIRVAGFTHREIHGFIHKLWKKTGVGAPTPQEK